MSHLGIDVSESHLKQRIPFFAYNAGFDSRNATSWNDWLARYVERITVKECSLNSWIDYPGSRTTRKKDGKGRGKGHSKGGKRKGIDAEENEGEISHSQGMNLIGKRNGHHFQSPSISSSYQETQDGIFSPGAYSNISGATSVSNHSRKSSLSRGVGDRISSQQSGLGIQFGGRVQQPPNFSSNVSVGGMRMGGGSMNSNMTTPDQTLDSNMSRGSSFQSSTYSNESSSSSSGFNLSQRSSQPQSRSNSNGIPTSSSNGNNLQTPSDSPDGIDYQDDSGLGFPSSQRRSFNNASNMMSSDFSPSVTSHSRSLRSNNSNPNGNGGMSAQTKMCQWRIETD